MPKRHLQKRAQTVRTLLKSLSANYRNGCPHITEKGVRELVKPAAGRRRARTAHGDAAVLPLPHAAEARPDRDRHVGYVANRPDDLPHPVPHSELPGDLHASHNRLVPREEDDRLGWAPRDQARGEIGGAEGAGDPQAGAPYAINVNAGWRLPFTGLLCKQPPYGGIRAIDIATGETLWDKPLGQARTNGPFGIPSMLPVTIGTPNNGGAVVTASGLIFIAAATDNLIRAIDIATGKVLWTDVLPAGGQATPMTYEIDGRQYLVIMAGGHHFMETPVGDALVSYALPKQ